MVSTDAVAKRRYRVRRRAVATSSKAISQADASSRPSPKSEDPVPVGVWMCLSVDTCPLPELAQGMTPGLSCNGKETATVAIWLIQIVLQEIV